MPKNVKGGPFGDIKIICEKKYHKAEKTCTKNWLRARLEPMSCFADLKKSSLTSMPRGTRVTSLVWQLVEATAYKAYKICHVVGLKKASAIICVFYEKRRLKMEHTDTICHRTKKLVTAIVRHIYYEKKATKNTTNAMQPSTLHFRPTST